MAVYLYSVVSILNLFVLFITSNDKSGVESPVPIIFTYASLDVQIFTNSLKGFTDEFICRICFNVNSYRTVIISKNRFSICV